MSKNNHSQGLNTKMPIVGSLSGLCFAGILTAMSIVLGKFLQIPNPFQEFIRISFENLPIMISGFALGPLAAMVVGIVADIIGCFLYGYAINWRITLGAAAIGFISGAVAKLVKKPQILRIILVVLSSHLVGSVLIKSWGLAKWYLASYDLGYWEFVLWRLVNYLLISIAECAIIYLIYKNNALRKRLEGIGKR